MARTDRRTHSASRLESVLRQSDENGRDDDAETPAAGVGERAAPDWLSGPPERPVTALSRYVPERWRSARVDPGRRGAVVLAAVGLAVVVIAGVSVLRDAPVAAPVPALPVVGIDAAATAARDAADPAARGDASSPAAAALPADTGEPAVVVVSVVGLVARSGLVELPTGSRIADALAAAGGTTEGADVLGLNLAARVADGDQILVGVAAADAPARPSGTVTEDGTAPAPSAGTAPAGGAAGGATDAAGRVDLNTATMTDFDALPGIGPVTAAAIVGWRDVNGKFTSVDQLGEVDGIGPVRLDKLRDQVFV